MRPVAALLLILKGYHCDPSKPLPYACLGSQKNYLSLHLMNVYGDPATEQWFKAAWRASGKKLDMGKACVRFKSAADVPLDVIGQVIARTSARNYIDRVEKLLAGRQKKKPLRSGDSANRRAKARR